MQELPVVVANICSGILRQLKAQESDHAYPDNKPECGRAIDSVHGVSRLTLAFIPFI